MVRRPGSKQRHHPLDAQRYRLPASRFSPTHRPGRRYAWLEIIAIIGVVLLAFSLALSTGHFL